MTLCLSDIEIQQVINSLDLSIVFWSKAGKDNEVDALKCLRDNVKRQAALNVKQL